MAAFQGFYAKLYNTDSPLSPHKMETFLRVLPIPKLTSSNRELNSAYISVIPKPVKNTSEIGNYCPISFIDNDLKIMTKIFATRMSGFIAKYIHKDQVGFIQGRQGPDQVRRAIDVISLLL